MRITIHYDVKPEMVVSAVVRHIDDRVFVLAREGYLATSAAEASRDVPYHVRQKMIAEAVAEINPYGLVEVIRERIIENGIPACMALQCDPSYGFTSQEIKSAAEKWYESHKTFFK